MSTGEWRQHHRREWQRRQTHMVHLRYLCLFSYSGIQHILCCIFCFACLHPVSCVWWCPTHIVLYCLLCFSSSRVLCMMVSNTSCVVIFALFVFTPCLVYDGVQHILCCIVCFVCLHPVSCVWWGSTHIMFYFLPCLSSSRVLCMMVSSIYCVVFFALYFFIPCFVYDGVQHILCCIFCFVVIPCLVYDGVQHILCCVFCFVCLRLM
jgi:hypothetical protein